MTIRRLTLALGVALVLLATIIGVSSHARAAAVCTPTSTVSGPYARDGAGDVCFQTANLCTFINSWNMTTLEVNGTAYTNRWVDSRTIAPLNGMYIIHYVGAYPWSHFEIGGTCSTTPPPTTPPPTTPPPTTPPPTTPPPTTPPPTTPPPTTPPPTTQPGQAPYGGTAWAIPGTVQAENYDTGGEGVAYHDTTTGNSGNAYRTDAVDIEATTDTGGGNNVGWTAAGEWLEYTINVAASGTYSLNARVSSQSGGGSMHVEIDGVNVTGAMAISSTGGWQTWTTVTRTGISLSSGQHVMRVAEDSAGFNLNWVSLTSGGTPPPTTPPPTTPPPGNVWRVDASGNITRNGVIFRVKGGSWFGLEGRHEPSNDQQNPSGAPMEMYMGNVFWAPSSRTYDQDIAEFKALGINLIRLPLVPQTLTGTDPQGMAPYLKNAPAVVIPNSRLALETVIKKLDAAGIYVLLDIHSCSNYIGWRKGRFDARPPWADATRENYDFKRENYSCAATGNPSTVTTTHPYDSTKWLANLRTLAGMQSSLGVSNIMGIDIYNEPHDYTWAEWKGYIEQAYTAINAVNPNVLIFAEGVGTTPGVQDGTPATFTQEPHGVVATNPNWGENLYSAGANPPNIPKDRLVFSPHTYGPSVFVQKMFMDPAQPQCAGLEGDAAAALDCNIVINPTLLRQGWQEHFGYLKAMGYAVVIGEYGGNMQWPGGKASLRDQQLWSHITDRTIDQQWQNAFVDYLLSVGIRDTIYWSINPESGDTGGLYTTPYQPGSNESGWGTWGAVDQTKLTLLRRLWDN